MIKNIVIPPPPVPIAPQFGLITANIISLANPYRGVPQGETPDAPIDRSTFLGTPVYCDLTFLSGTYTDDANNTITLPEIKFQTVLMVVDQAKNVVVTNISGRDGTVKEYIGLDDYHVTVMGLIPKPNGQYPKNEMSDFIKVLKAPIAVDVASWYLQQFDIDKLVITNYTFPQEEGKYSVQGFQLECLSDKPVEAIITES